MRNIWMGTKKLTLLDFPDPYQKYMSLRNNCFPQTYEQIETNHIIIVWARVVTFKAILTLSKNM